MECSELFVQAVNIGWEKIAENSYLRNIEAFHNVERIQIHKPVTFFVGENGSGKSTLLEAMAIADGFNPEGGTRNYCFSTHDSHSELYKAITLVRTIKAKWGFFLRAESFYNFATKEEEYSSTPCGKPKPMHYHMKSHGESFLAVMQHYFEGNSIYYLDEPEAALSPQCQLTLLLEIDRCRKSGSQFFIATHSPILLGLPDADILTFDDGQIHVCKYEETNSYRITSLFLDEKAHLLEKLLRN